MDFPGNDMNVSLVYATSAYVSIRQHTSAHLTITGEGGATAELLMELPQQTALTPSFTTMKLCNGHTQETGVRTVKPNSRLAQELDVCMPGMEGDVDLNFSSLVEDGTKTGTLRTGHDAISGKLYPPLPLPAHSCVQITRVTCSRKFLC